MRAFTKVVRTSVCAALVLLALGACKKEPEAAAPPAEPGAPAAAPSSAPAGWPGAAAPGAAAPERDPKAVYALVNGTEVLEGDVSRVVTQIAMRNGVPPQMLPPQIAAQLRQAAEESVISRELLKQHVAADGKEIPVAEVDAKYAEVLKGLPPGKTEADLEALIGVAAPDLKKEIAADLAISKILDGYREQAKPSDQEIKSFYDDNAERFSTPAQISASHILLRVPPEATPEQTAEIEQRAKKLSKKARAADAAAFAKLADEHSEDPSAKSNHGDLGFFEPGSMVPEFSAAAQKLKKGQVSDPVRSQFGFHVIRGQGSRDAGKRPLAEVEPTIVAQLSEQGVRERMDKLVADLRAKAKIEIKRPSEPAPAPAAAPGLTPSPAMPPAPAPAPAPTPAP